MVTHVQKSRQVADVFIRRELSGQKHILADLSAKHAPMGSPRGVPVPCTATAQTEADDKPRAFRAEAISACCEGPLGAVSDEDLPS